MVDLGTLVDRRVQHVSNGHKGIIRAAYVEPAPMGFRPKLILVVEATSGRKGELVTWYLEDVRMIVDAG